MQTQARLQEVGANLRLARLRRRLTMAEVAERLGVDRRTIAAMEAGRAQIAISVVAGSLWIYGLDRDLAGLADPDRDTLGKGLEARVRPQIARKRAVDNDF